MKQTTLPKLTIITVCFNACLDLEKTLLSVYQQHLRAEVEHIVIDGGSTDTTLELLETHKNNINIIVSEQDQGVYDAMNKGIHLSGSEWIYFLNAGDVFLDEHSLSKILHAQNDTDIIYSDVIVDSKKGRDTFHTDFVSKKLNHQGFVYKKMLHQRYGAYAVISGFTAADYLFFLQLSDVKVKKLEQPIAIFQVGGLSSTVKAVHQKYCLDFLAGKTSRGFLVAILLLYPFYRRWNELKLKFLK